MAGPKCAPRSDGRGRPRPGWPRLLTARWGRLRRPGGSGLVFEESLELRPLAADPAAGGRVGRRRRPGGGGRRPLPAGGRDPGGPGPLADGAHDLEEEAGPVRAHLLGCGEERPALTRSGAPVGAADRRRPQPAPGLGGVGGGRPCVAEGDPGGLVLVDGDLQPDWRIPSSWLADLLARCGPAAGSGWSGVTKHSSLARGGAPLLGQLERQAERPSGHRACGGCRWPRPGPTSVPGSRSWSPGSTPTPASRSGSTCRRGRSRRAAPRRPVRPGRRRRLPRLPLPAQRRRPAGGLPRLAARRRVVPDRGRLRPGRCAPRRARAGVRRPPPADGAVR